MNTTEQSLRRRLLNILHLGFVEVRNLALASGQEQIADLADAMEILPRLVDQCDKDDYELISFVLKTYHEKYRSSYNFPARLEEYDVPETR